MFQSFFFWFMSFIFHILAPPLNMRFEISFKSFWIYSSAKDSLRSAYTWYFLYTAFCLTSRLGGYATDNYTVQAWSLVCVVPQCHKPKWQNKTLSITPCNKNLVALIFLHNKDHIGTWNMSPAFVYSQCHLKKCYNDFFHILKVNLFHCVTLTSHSSDRLWRHSSQLF